MCFWKSWWHSICIIHIHSSVQLVSLVQSYHLLFCYYLFPDTKGWVFDVRVADVSLSHATTFLTFLTRNPSFSARYHWQEELSVSTTTSVSGSLFGFSYCSKPRECKYPSIMKQDHWLHPCLGCRCVELHRRALPWISTMRFVLFLRMTRRDGTYVAVMSTSVSAPVSERCQTSFVAI